MGVWTFTSFWGRTFGSRRLSLGYIFFGYNTDQGASGIWPGMKTWDTRYNGCIMDGWSWIGGWATPKFDAGRHMDDLD